MMTVLKFVGKRRDGRNYRRSVYGYFRGNIDSLIKRDEHIFEFRAEERLNKAGTEKGVANYILQKLHEKGRERRQK